MTSTIKVNNIQNQCGTDIVKRSGATTTVGSGAGNTVVVCGSTVTIGRCGGSVALASGATQTGFGREGSVNWQTGSIKTSTFTAASGEGYFINSGSAITMNLPAGSAGAIVAVSDYARNFATHNFTIVPNGSEKIGGEASSLILDVDGQALTLVYVDSTKGWINVQNAEDTEKGQGFAAATGGNTVITCGDYKTHIFTGPGTFCVSATGVVDYLVVAGGGAGGFDGGGGGGAGGFRSSNTTTGLAPSGIPVPTAGPLAATTGLTVPAQAYSIQVGGGATCKPSTGVSGSGVNSIFSTITSAGGGGGSPGGPACRPSGAGGSGGGGDRGTSSASDLGAGNTPPVSPPQGNPGTVNGNAIGGGGGGAGAAAVSDCNGNGGAGSFIAPSVIGPTAPSYGSPGPVTGRFFAGGGAGGHNPSSVPCATQTGGPGGGGGVGVSGTVNTGGGGGAGDAAGGVPQTGKSGGSGIVIIRYKFQ
jgi:hypothetical protein